jgi:hypothetical protein
MTGVTPKHMLQTNLSKNTTITTLIIVKLNANGTDDYEDNP